MGLAIAQAFVRQLLLFSVAGKRDVAQTSNSIVQDQDAEVAQAEWARHQTTVGASQFIELAETMQSAAFDSILQPAKWQKSVVVVCGPPGVGKGTLIRKLLKELPEKYGLALSHTTRKRRPTEADGKDYHFVSKTVMQADIKAGKFIEHLQVHGHHYGTSLQAVQDVIESGKVCILDINVAGAETMKSQKLDSQAIYVFVKPPSMEVLKQRLQKAHYGLSELEKKYQIASRIEGAKKEMADMEKKDYWTAIITNDKLEKTYKEFKDILQKACVPENPVPEGKKSKGSTEGKSSKKSDKTSGSGSDSGSLHLHPHYLLLVVLLMAVY